MVWVFPPIIPLRPCSACYWSKETFICEVEVLRQELKECELLVEGQFASESQMEEWGYTQHFGLKPKHGV